MTMNLPQYRDKVLACWLGKNIGGTLGAPVEWRRQINNLDFYMHNLDGMPLPNDDLDLQLVWLVAMEEKGVRVDAQTLGEYWLLYITPHWAEYGNSKVNMRAGLMPPLCGAVNNPYKDSCGSFIRSEIWACLAPGDPALAARYAYEDGQVDHGLGEGAYAGIFCAAVESAAFAESDAQRLIDIGLSYIPEDCGTSKAVRLAVDCHKKGMTWQEARDEILRHHRGGAYWWHCSPEDEAKGFKEGVEGYDAPSNIGIVIIGWLYGEGDFGKTLCIAVNCGEDTDCTAATVGSIFGIIHGTKAIPERWLAPVGRSIKTACVNLGEMGIFNGQLPQDIDDLTLRTEKLMRRVSAVFRPRLEFSESLPDDGLLRLDKPDIFYADGPKFTFASIDVYAEYLDGPYVKSGEATRVRLIIHNRYKVRESLNIKWYADDGWEILPGKEGKVIVPHERKVSTEFTLKSDNPRNTNRFVVELTEDGKHTVMLVPVLLLNGLESSIL